METRTGWHVGFSYLGFDFLGFDGGSFIRILGQLLGLLFFEVGVCSLRSFTHSDHVPNTRHGGGNFFGTFDQGQEGDDDGGTESPCDGYQDPEGEVVAGEDTGGDGEEGPDDDQHERQDVSTTLDPALCTTEHGGILFEGGQTTLVFFDQRNARIQGRKVEILPLNSIGC